MTYGLLAALSWGVAGLGAALAARRIGAFRTVIIGEAVALAGYGVLFFFGHFSLRGVGPVAWLLLLAGVVGLGGYLTLYRGLESGCRALRTGPALRRGRALRMGRPGGRAALAGLLGDGTGT